MAKSGQTSKKVVKSAAAFLAMTDDQRVAWLDSKLNYVTVASWAASLVNQAPNKKYKKEKK
jgi:hypothetical protein